MNREHLEKARVKTIATLVGIRANVLAAILAGKNDPSLPTLEKIAGGLNMPIQEVMAAIRSRQEASREKMRLTMELESLMARKNSGERSSMM